MRAEFINPFLQAAREVLESDLGSTPTRGSIGLKTTAYTTNDVTAVIGVTGQVAGMVLYSLSEKTARGMVSHMMDQEFEEFDSLAQSGIGEIGNVITGRAAMLLSDAGYKSELAPPMLIIGRGTLISTLDMQRLVVVFDTGYGVLEVQVALKEIPAMSRSLAA